MTLPAQTWVWRASYVSAHDGDTVTCVLDLGIGLTITTPLRLLEVYAPELSEENGLKARDLTRDWFRWANQIMLRNGNKWPLIVRTYKADPREKYGRWLARIWRKSDRACLNEAIVSAGLAAKEP